MAFIDPIKKQDDGTGMNVLGPGAQPNQPQPTQPDQGATPVQNIGTSGPTQMKSPTKTNSSGMFTGIKKYMAANQAAPEKMVSSIGSKQMGTANQIAQNAQNQKMQTQQAIAANNASLNTSLNTAGQIVQAATGQKVTPKYAPGTEPAPINQSTPPVTETQAPPATPPAQEVPALTLTEQQQKLFADYMAGNAGTAQIQDIDTSAQRNELERMNALGKGLNAEQGRNEALYQTFGKDRKYSTGQTGLDAALLGRAAPQLQELSSRIAQRATDESKNLRNMEQELGGQLGLQRKAESEFGDTVKGMGEEALKMTDADVDAAVIKANEENAAKMERLRAGNISVADVGNYISDSELLQSGVKTDKAMKDALKFLKNPGNSAGFGGNKDIDNWNDNFAKITGISGKQARAMYNVPGGPEKLMSVVQGIKDNANNLDFLKNQFVEKSKRGDITSEINMKNLGRSNVVNENQLKSFDNLKKLIQSNTPLDLEGGKVDAGQVFSAKDASNITANSSYNQNAATTSKDYWNSLINQSKNMQGTNMSGGSEKPLKDMYNDMQQTGMSSKDIKKYFKDNGLNYDRIKSEVKEDVKKDERNKKSTKPALPKGGSFKGPFGR